jgi:hypothetical protein
MKKVLLACVLAIAQMISVSTVHGQTFYDSGINTYAPVSTGNSVIFSMSLNQNSQIWNFNTNDGDLMSMTEYGESAGSLNYETDEEEIYPQNGGVTFDPEWTQSSTTYFYRTVVFREDSPWIRWVSSTQQIFQFISGPDPRANVTVLEPDTIQHRSAGPIEIVVETPDLSGQVSQEYDVFVKTFDGNSWTNYDFIAEMNHNETDTFEVLVSGEPGEYVAIEVKVGNNQIGNRHGYWGGDLKPGTVADVSVSVPISNGVNQMVAHGYLSYGGYPTLQWFEVTGPASVYGLVGPVNRGNYTGNLTETFDTPTTPGIYTLTHHANNELGDNSVSVEFEILAPNGITDLEFAENVLVYPNPAIDQVTIKSPEKAIFKVTSVAGRTVLEGTLEADRGEGLKLSSGMYTVSFYGESVTAHKRLIVSK